MYKPKNYTLSELVHPQIINYFINRFGKSKGEKHVWRRLDAECLEDIQTIRNKWFKKLGSGIYVNRMNLVPPIDSRGLRPPNDPDGSFYSTHKEGNTFDLEPVNGKLRELYDMIIEMVKNGELKKINTLENFEDTLKWVHAGYMNTDEKPLIIKL